MNDNRDNSADTEVLQEVSCLVLLDSQAALLATQRPANKTHSFLSRPAAIPGPALTFHRTRDRLLDHSSGGRIARLGARDVAEVVALLARTEDREAGIHSPQHKILTSRLAFAGS